MNKEENLLEKMIDIIQEEYRISQEAIKISQTEYWFGRMSVLEELLQNFKDISNKDKYQQNDWLKGL